MAKKSLPREKRRGRPPKKRGPGRPLKTSSSPTSTPRKRGRPRLAVTSSAGGPRKNDTVGKQRQLTRSLNSPKRPSHPDNVLSLSKEPIKQDVTSLKAEGPPTKSSQGSFKIPRLPHRTPDTFEKVWDNALTLAGTITDHYAMRRNEQKEALKFALEELDKGDLFVELGIGHGHTASIISYGAKLLGYHYIGIDNFTVEATEKTTREHLDRLNLPYTLQVGNSRTMGFNKPIDILLIDASHDVVAVNEDSQNWLRYIRPGGLVMYHDYSINLTPDNPHWGIKLAVDTYTRYWKTESLIDWLLVRRKPLR